MNSIVYSSLFFPHSRVSCSRNQRKDIKIFCLNTYHSSSNSTHLTLQLTKLLILTISYTLFPFLSFFFFFVHYFFVFFFFACLRFCLIIRFLKSIDTAIVSFHCCRECVLKWDVFLTVHLIIRKSFSHFLKTTYMNKRKCPLSENVSYVRRSSFFGGISGKVSETFKSRCLTNPMQRRLFLLP